MKKRCAILLAFGLLAVWTPAGAVAAPDKDQVQQKLMKIEAAFALNFARYTIWPHEKKDQDKQPLVMMIVGDEAMANELKGTFTRHFPYDLRPATPPGI